MSNICLTGRKLHKSNILKQASFKTTWRQERKCKCVLSEILLKSFLGSYFMRACNMYLYNYFGICINSDLNSVDLVLSNLVGIIAVVIENFNLNVRRLGTEFQRCSAVNDYFLHSDRSNLGENYLKIGRPRYTV